MHFGSGNGKAIDSDKEEQRCLRNDDVWIESWIIERMSGMGQKKENGF